jgi:hypothetical protein
MKKTALSFLRFRTMNESAADAFRWQAFFQPAAQPMFLLNRRRRILFVNRAWESCTGPALADVRGRVCRPPKVAPSGTIRHKWDT